MDFILTEPEVRVLASLVEKEATTPDNYPLSLNSLVNACNQKTNREPVVSYDADEVHDALMSLKHKGLALVCEGRDARVLKYDNYMADKLELTAGEAAVLCVLMLRGAQTAGELRLRTERIYAFSELSQVEDVLESLISREHPLAAKQPLSPGRKENRYIHLLGERSEEDAAAVVESSLRERIESLESQVEELKQEFAKFKQEFE